MLEVEQDNPTKPMKVNIPARRKYRLFVIVQKLPFQSGGFDTTAEARSLAKT